LRSTSATFGTDNTARFAIDCWDYGTIGTATVQHGTGANLVTVQMKLPKDDNRNGLPDAGWWAIESVSGTPVSVHVDDTGIGGDDSEVGPTGSTASGDGLVKFEEYRGFVVQSVHQRTSPEVMDLFVNLQNGLPLGFTSNLPFSKWSILTAEMTSDRIVNANYTNAGIGGSIPGHVTQRALKVIDGGYNTSDPGVDGVTTTLTGNPAPPAQVTVITIYTQSIRFLSPPRNSRNSSDPVDPEKTSQTVAHEVGHGMQLYHIDVQHQCPLGTPTVMVTNYFLQTTNVNDCAWTHIPHFYDVSDFQSFTLR
jgi:hypothetical protein